MTELDLKREKCREFNNNQIEIGSPLMTLKGSKIRRSRYKVGKAIGGKIYLHKSYYRVLPDLAKQSYISFKDEVPFEFNCIRYDTQTYAIAFIECADFDTAREPRVGRIFEFNEHGEGIISRSYQQVYHHKWAMVKNDYPGFDVEESWRWSRRWLNILTRRADGSCIENWLEELKEFGLE